MADVNGQRNPPLAIENFPPALRRRMRVLAAQRDTTMRQLTLDALYRHVGRLERDGAEAGHVERAAD